MNNKALVLFSGGQDSTTCLIWAMIQFGPENVQAIGFDYGQKHYVELSQAREIAKMFKIPYHVFDIKGLLTGSALVDHTKDVNAKHDKIDYLPATFTAGRNALFLTIAASHAFNQNINNIVTGVCETDYSGYPDCRQQFIESQELTLRFAMERAFEIHTPLMHITKAQTWKLANDMQVALIHDAKLLQKWDELDLPSNFVEIIRTQTLTDYNGSMKMNEWGMGELNNPASELRAKGYFEAKEKGWI